MVKIKNSLEEASLWVRLELPGVLAAMFSRRWWWATLLVLVAMAFFARMGIWQLSRRAERMDEANKIRANLTSEPILIDGTDIEANFENRYRPVIVEGVYDHSLDIVLRGQRFAQKDGIALITPLIISGSNKAVLVNRGWLPYSEYPNKKWKNFPEPGIVTVKGYIFLSQPKPANLTSSYKITSSGEYKAEWFWLDIEAMQTQIPYDLLSVSIQQRPEPGWKNLPVTFPLRNEIDFDLSNGTHLGYVIQWFSFALVAGGSYINFISKNLTKKSKETL